VGGDLQLAHAVVFDPHRAGGHGRLRYGLAARGAGRCTRACGGLAHGPSPVGGWRPPSRANGTGRPRSIRQRPVSPVVVVVGPRPGPPAARLCGSVPHASRRPMSDSALLALSPLDGRYASKVDALRPIFSEYGLIRARVRVEIEWLLALAAEPGIAELPAFSEAAQQRLRAL